MNSSNFNSKKTFLPKINSYMSTLSVDKITLVMMLASAQEREIPGKYLS